MYHPGSKSAVVYVIQKSNKYGLKQGTGTSKLPLRAVVYVIQKSNKYGLKQVREMQVSFADVVYVIQKSNKYGLKQARDKIRANMDALCMSFKKVTNTD